MTSVERADRASRARAMAAPFFGLLLLSVQQWLFFGREWEQVGVVQLGIWMALALLALAVFLSGGLWFMPRPVRRLVEDGETERNRQRAITSAFVVAMIVALLVFAVSPFEPISAQRAAHIIVSMSLGVGFVTFGIAESRSLD